RQLESFVPRPVEGEGVVEVPVGPIHAGVIQPGHFHFAAIGELVLQLEARLFYTHRGIEKLAEGRTPEQALPHPDAKETPPPRFRGMPELVESACCGDGACAIVCPTLAIEVTARLDGWTWHLDRAACV